MNTAQRRLYTSVDTMHSIIYRINWGLLTAITICLNNRRPRRVAPSYAHLESIHLILGQHSPEWVFRLTGTRNVGSDDWQPLACSCESHTKAHCAGVNIAQPLCFHAATVMALDIAWSADEKNPYGWVSGRGGGGKEKLSGKSLCLSQPKPMRRGSFPNNLFTPPQSGLFFSDEAILIQREW